MRTSNKILLGILLLPLFILASLNAALYAKYKSGHYTTMKSVKEDRYTRRPLKNIHKIAVYGLENLRIIPSDTMRLEIERDSRGHLHYTINGDSLIIHGDTTITRPGGARDTERSYQDVNLYLPSSAIIAADNSGVNIRGSKDSLKAASYQLTLTNAASLTVADNGADSNPVYFKSFIIKASNAPQIELAPHARISDLQLSMIESVFNDNGASIDKLTVNADKTSNITLKGDNIGRMNAAH